MRIWKTTLFLSALAAASWARPALAEAPAAGPADTAPQPSLKLDLSPSVSPWVWATPRANVASLAPITLPALPRPRLWSSGGGGPLRISGGVVLGLGLAVLFGAGVTGIVAAAETSRLGDNCPNKVCYEGTRGADALNTARDAAYAADWLIGIGAPVTASGTILLLYSAVVERNYGLLVYPSSVFRASPGGLAFDF
jgi:hypothetical protein